MKKSKSNAIAVLAAALGFAVVAVHAQEAAPAGETEKSGPEAGSMSQTQPQTEPGTSYGQGKRPMMPGQAGGMPMMGGQPPAMPMRQGQAQADEGSASEAAESAGKPAEGQPSRQPMAYGQPAEMPMYGYPGEMPMMYPPAHPRPMLRSRRSSMMHGPMRHRMMNPTEHRISVEQRLENIEALLKQLVEMRNQ